MSAEPTPVPCTDVRTTVDDPDAAHRIARALVEEGVAACVHVSSPITSYYWWEDELQCTVEYEVVARTSDERVALTCERILALHPYGLPAVVVARGAATPAYGRWVETSGPDR